MSYLIPTGGLDKYAAVLSFEAVSAVLSLCSQKRLR